MNKFRNIISIILINIIIILGVSGCSNEAKVNFQWPIYVIKEDGEVRGYLLGTMHPGGWEDEIFPFPQRILESLRDSSVLVGELSKNDFLNPDVEVIEKYNKKEPLFNENDDEEINRTLEDKLNEYGLEKGASEGLNRFGIYNLFVSAIYTEDNYTNSVEYKLYEKARNMRNIGLESLEDQMEILYRFVNLSNSKDDGDWISKISTKEKEKEIFDKIYKWYITDHYKENNFEDTLSDEGKEVLLYGRNLEWEIKTSKLIRTDGEKPFIAVGVRHLYGTNGMIDLLEKNNFKLEIIETI